MGRPSWNGSQAGLMVWRHSLALVPQPPTEWTRTDGHRRDPPPLHRALRGGRSPGSAVRVTTGSGPDAAVRERRHGAVQALLPGPGEAAVQPRHERAEVRADAGHRG